MKQPSGFSFEARQFGDEWYNFVETKDGFGVYKNETTGVWEYYLPSADTNSGEDGSKGRTGRGRKARRGKSGNSTEAASNVRIGRIQDAPVRIIVGEADPIALGIPKGLRPPRVLGQNILPPSLPTELENGLISTAIRGSIPLLVIGVDYADAPATYTAGQIQPLLFGTSDSVSDYYNKTSYSSVTITTPTEFHGTSNDGFVGWLRLTGNHPNTGLSGWNSTANQQIAKDAILAADSSINFAQYDTNGNGVVEPTELSVMIIVAGYEASYSPHGSPSVWAHCMGMGSVGYPTIDGKTIQQYAMFGEKHDNHLATFGVMAHELGHLMFGLPDLYDTDTNNGDSEGIGFFDLMGGGSWGAVYGAYSGSSPTQLSAWCKEYLSWGIVNTILSSQSVYFPKTDGNSSSVSRINTADANQYFLIENRQFTGYDRGFQDKTGASGHGGLVIYHIDKLKTPPLHWNVNADANDKGVDIEEANEGSLGYSMLDTKASPANTAMFFFAGNNTSFTNTTTPGSKLKNGTATNIFITDVSSYGDTMAATVVLPSDTISPTVVITSPTSESTYTTTNSIINLGGTASDDVGVTQVTWSNDRGGSGTATGTTSWSVGGITLQSGTNVITVTARDAANNTGTDTLTVTYNPLDTISPIIVITSPISESTYTTTSGSLNLGGTASDNVGVTQVTWSNSRGGSGTATGTTSWSVGGITLQSGTNVITVTARDAANNTETDTLTVTYNPPDTISPTVTITSPTSESTYTTTNGSLNLGGTASDNVGITQVAWSNDRGGNDTASGTTSWSVSGITLQSGTNVITVTARDAANNTGTDTLTVTYNPVDTISPTVVITSPTSESTYTTTSSSLDLGGTASDNVGVTEVYWTNDRGGNGTATGTTSWSVGGVVLQSGVNVVTVTARDAANNAETDTITITYSEELANLMPYKPWRWSDKIVVSNTKRTKKDSNPLYTTDKLYIDFAVVNYGWGIAKDFWIILYVDGKKREPSHVSQLNVGQYVFAKDYPIGTLSAGKHSIKIKADVEGNVKESNESDNEYTKTINIINR